MCSPKVIVLSIVSISILICLILKKNKENFKSSPYPLPKYHNQIFQGHTSCRPDIKKGVRPGNSPFRRRA
jgi:hypothetical protein